jgi:hypothetical protein
MKYLSRLFSAFVLILCFCGGCSPEEKKPVMAKDCYYVEIAPDRYVPVKFSRYFNLDMTIKYKGQVVKYAGHVEAGPPCTLMEYEGKLYVLALDTTPIERSRWHWRCYEQKGNSFKEISAKDFPRSIAILNLWRPGDPARYAVGLKPEDKIDMTVQNRKLDINDKYFISSYQAKLWYMLEEVNSLDHAEKNFYGDKAKAFLEDYIAKYNPVRLTSMEMKPVPKAESEF